jgi:DNA mismatch repair protein MutS
MVKNHNIISEYTELDNKYKDEYKKYLVLLQVGSFYEMYSSNPNEVKLKNICELLNIILTKKNKAINNISKSNPWMAGIPCHSLEKYLDILLNNNYTIIVYNQYLDKKTIKRKLDKIYSIGTYIDSEKSINNENIIISIYIEIIKNKILAGISIIDLSTGLIKVLEIYNEDYNKLIEDLNKEFIIYNPKEVILTIINSKNNEIFSNIENNLIDFFQHKNIILHCNNQNFSNLYIKLEFQNEFFKKIFFNLIDSLNNTLTPIEILDLERYEYCRLSLLFLLKFAYNHDNSIVSYLNKPEILMNKNILNLHNNALYQLNILSNCNAYKYNSLFDIINKTSTNLGKRFLKNNLSEPLNDISELNYRYDLISKLQCKNKYIKYEKELDNIIDIEKYHKKLSINKLQPYQYGRLNNSYKACINLLKLAKDDFTHFNYDILNLFNDYYKEYINYFNISNLELFNINLSSNNSNNLNTNLNIFNIGIIEEIDNLYNKISIEKDKLINLSNELSQLINNDKIEIKHTDRDGYFLVLTKTRANKLKKIIESNPKYKNLQFDNKTVSNTYITSNDIKLLSRTIINLQEKLLYLIKNKYFEVSLQLFTKYANILSILNKFVEYIDFIKSNTKISIIYNYNKPNIINQEYSFINVTEIRHPISEQLNSDFNYITNNISLNYNKTGTLLYGSNGVGKSTLMKAIGLNVILAQIGCFVAAKSFEFMPYSNLFTRIDHSDNLFKGISSFESEILELKTILNYSNNNSLVLGDEILNSTENISAISLIASSINYFLNNNISFIFASHLHQIPNYIDNSLKEKLNISHLTMEYDNIKKCFIYTRKLHSGPSIKNYGLIVAQALLNNEYIINSALDVQNKLLDNNSTIDTKILNNKNVINIKSSKYNKNLIMSECYICNDLNIKHDNHNILETHHIIYQQNFDSNNKCTLDNKKHLHKNTKSNLVNLCKYHHLEVHKNNIIIKDWIKTTNGKKLDYNILFNE